MRFFTKQEFEIEYGKKWRRIVMWGRSMDYLFGMPCDEYIESINKEEIKVHEKFAFKHACNTWMINDKMITKKTHPYLLINKLAVNLTYLNDNDIKYMYSKALEIGLKEADNFNKWPIIMPNYFYIINGHIRLLLLDSLNLPLINDCDLLINSGMFFYGYAGRNKIKKDQSNTTLSLGNALMFDMFLKFHKDVYLNEEYNHFLDYVLSHIKVECGKKSVKELINKTLIKAGTKIGERKQLINDWSPYMYYSNGYDPDNEFNYTHNRAVLEGTYIENDFKEQIDRPKRKAFKINMNGGPTDEELNQIERNLSIYEGILDDEYYKDDTPKTLNQISQT